MSSHAIKTVEYLLDFRTAVLTTGVRYETPFYPVYIPEVTGRNFHSAFLNITCRDDQASAATRGNLISRTLGLRVTGKAFSDVITTETLTDSTEHMAYRFSNDFTTYCNNNASGSTLTYMQAAFYVSGTAVATPIRYSNITTKLILTYQYDPDLADTRLKTVKIPISSAPTTLTTSLTTVGGGGNQIPALDTFLPEADKVYRQQFIEAFANEAAVATTTYALDMAIGTGLSSTGYALVNGCQSAPWYYKTWIIPSGALDTSLSHAFQARSSGVTARFTNLGAILNVTYEYSAKNSTGVMNSLVIPWDSDDNWAETSGTATLVKKTILISEPDPIVLKQSAVGFFFNEAADVAGLHMRVQPQIYKAYTHTAGTATCGQYSIVHRFDPAYTNTGTVLLNRGYNDLNFNIFGTDTTERGSNLNGYFLLNYTSACATGSEINYNNTIQRLLSPTVNRAIYSLITNSGYTHVQPSSVYYNSIGYLMNNQVTIALNHLSIDVATTGNETSDLGWRHVYGTQFRTDAEMNLSTNYFDADGFFRRYIGDPSELLDLHRARQMRLRFLTALNGDMTQYITAHSNVFYVTGSLIGYVGNPSGTAIRVYGTSGYRHLGTTYADHSGFYTFPWYDNTETLFCEAIDPSGYGRSSNSIIGA